MCKHVYNLCMHASMYVIVVCVYICIYTCLHIMRVSRLATSIFTHVLVYTCIQVLECSNYRFCLLGKTKQQKITGSEVPVSSSVEHVPDWKLQASHVAPVKDRLSRGFEVQGIGFIG